MREMAYQALTKGFSQLSPDTAVVLVPFSGVPAAHLPLSHHFLLMRNLSLKDIAGYEIIKVTGTR